MKPISVRFKCFGPYMEEQFIDFRQLEKSGLFLICGKTGSGKTTILDAMCYALYGKSSGGYRGGLSDMRCKHAAQTDKTFVEYIFSSGENTYRFYRGVQPKKQQKRSLEAGKPQSFNDECECQILRDGQFVPMADTKAKQTYMDAKAEEILGLRYDQFKQVIILPQGQFEKLLTSNSGEKESILVSLFHAQRWDRIADLVHRKVMDEKKQLERKGIELRGQMTRFHCESLEELRTLTDQTQQEAADLQTRCQALEQTVAQRRTAHDQARDADKAFLRLEEARRKYAALEAQTASMDRQRTRLTAAQAAEAITPQYTAWQQAASAARQALRDQTAREENLETARQQQEAICLQRRRHEANREAYEEKKTQRTVLESLSELYQSLSDKKSAQTNADDALTRAGKALETAGKALTQRENDLTAAVKHQGIAAQAYEQGQKAYIQGIGGILAQQLVEGEKCPVCGSRHHPEPAQTGERSISEEKLEQLKHRNIQAMNAVTAATTAHREAEQAQQQAQLTQAECAAKATAAQESYAAALNQRVYGIESEAQRTAALRKLRQEIDSFEEQDRSMNGRITKAAGDLQTAVELAAAARTTAREKSDAEAEALSAWTTARQEAHFPTQEDYRAAVMTAAQRQTLHAAIIQFETDLRNAEAAVTEQEAALGDAVRPNVAGAKALLDAATEEKEQADRDYTLKNSAWEDQRQILQNLEQKLPILEKNQLRNRENEEFARRLRGDSGSSLQRYVLGVMLTAITTQANRLLKDVYGGRYQLYRSDEATGNVHKRGLELVVADQDGRRSVNSLSGGEKFLLSLSLGIGLAAVVQAQGKGIHLEAMFIDEGFGSLDSKCIDDAMEILESVRRSAGIVGIISHVERLAETIPAKIEITKTNHGSTCKVSC